MAVSFRIRAARADDHDAVVGLLEAAELPLAGVDAGFPSHYAVASIEERVIGVAGLEPYAAAGLLRSVAVHDSVRGQGLGRALVEERLEHARSVRLDRIFLLTTSADGYFRALGFAPADRREAPPNMRASAEFAGACPASAACLARRP